MKKFKILAFLFFICMFSVSATAQLPPDMAAVEDNQIYASASVEVKPDYSGGIKSFYSYIAKNFRMPEEFKGNGKILVSFIVEKDGSLTDIKVIRDIGYDSAREALRVIQECPKWKPGILLGKAVRTLYTLPISVVSQ